MYKFIDTNEFQDGVELPSEAMTFNGLTFEHEIEGYRTLSVEGRELIGRDLNTLVVGTADGSYLQNVRIPDRVITVNYALFSNSNEDFRKKFNKLNMLLRGQEVKFHFNDESDKYFVGTLQKVSTVSTGTNNVVSSFEIYCTLPYKTSYVPKVYTYDVAAPIIALCDFNTPPKITGSVAENAHIFKRSGGSTIFPIPSSGAWAENNQNHYDGVKAIGGSTASFSYNGANAITSTCSSFNALWALEKQYPQLFANVNTVPQKLALAKNIIDNIDIIAHGRGTSPNGNKFYLNAFNVVTNAWATTPVSHSSSVISKLLYSYHKADLLLSNDGFIHVLTYADSSNGVIASFLEMDYVSIEIKLKGLDNDKITITSEGTYPSPVEFEIENTSDNGFIGLVTDDAIVQVGNPEEVDGVPGSKDELLYVNHIISDEVSKVTFNNGTLRDSEHISARQNGNMMFAVTGSDQRTRTVSDYSNDTANGWHGPALSFKVPNDANGGVGALKWKLDVYFHYKTITGSSSGFQDMVVSDADGGLIMGIIFKQRWRNSPRVTVQFWVGTKLVWEDANSDRWNNFTGRIIMEKLGSTHRFTLTKLESGNANTQQYFSYEDFTLTKPAVKFSYWNGVWGNQPATDMSIYEIFFTKRFVDTFTDIPNLFGANSMVLIKSNDNTVKSYKRPSSKSEYQLDLNMQDRGSQPILVDYGKTDVNILVSPFAGKPNVTAKVYERFI